MHQTLIYSFEIAGADRFDLILSRMNGREKEPSERISFFRFSNYSFAYLQICFYDEYCYSRSSSRTDSNEKRGKEFLLSLFHLLMFFPGSYVKTDEF